ncbi:MAG: cupin domain-containing protein [Phycisphaerae bacterium]
MAKPVFDVSSTQGGHLAELCPVVPGAIVSKPLIDTGTLKQVLFSVDAGQEISEHRAPYVATVHIVSGRLRFGVAGESRTMAEADWLVMPPNTPHDLFAEEPTLFLLTLVKG